MDELKLEYSECNFSENLLQLFLNHYQPGKRSVVLTMAGRKFVKLTAEPSNEEINLRVYSSFSHIKPDSAVHENEYK